MYPNPTLEIIKLAVPCYEALKKLIPEWEWEPRRGEIGVANCNMRAMNKNYIADKGDLLVINTSGVNAVIAGTPRGSGFIIDNASITPILDWELMEEMVFPLPSEKYQLKLHRSTEGYAAKVWVYKKIVKTTGHYRWEWVRVLLTKVCTSRQHAVMQAIIELAKQEVGK